MGQEYPYLTREDVRELVARIDSLSADSRIAHILEDGLHRRVLRAIAFGSLSEGHGEYLAKEALKTRLIKFDRWYA